jgi:hypothetical protein
MTYVNYSSAFLLSPLHSFAEFNTFCVRRDERDTPHSWGTIRVIKCWFKLTYKEREKMRNK